MVLCYRWLTLLNLTEHVQAIFHPILYKENQCIKIFFLHFYYNLKCLLLLSTFLWKLVSAMGYIFFKVIVTFYITIQSFFLRIARYKLWILRKKVRITRCKLTIVRIKSELWEVAINLFFSPLQKQKMVRTRTAIYKLRISRKKIWIEFFCNADFYISSNILYLAILSLSRFFHRIVRKTSELISHNYDVFRNKEFTKPNVQMHYTEENDSFSLCKI